ncbi:hypothetical protein ACQZV8_08800 [Magnetococcales bacterium HHB-1]
MTISSNAIKSRVRQQARKYFALILIATSLFTLSVAQATSIYPTVTSITPNSQPISLKVINNSNKTVTYQILVQKREMNLDGTTIYTPSNDLRLSKRTIRRLKSKAQRVIKVRWNGGKNLKTEQAYYVIAQNLGQKVDKPTTLEQRKGGITLRVSAGALIYVTPLGVKAKLELSSVQRRSKNEIVLDLFNRGHKHIYLDKPSIKTIFSSIHHQGITLSTSEKKKIYQILTNQNILAQAKRHFIIKIK